MKKRIFSILLCLCMVLMLFPVTALAEEPPSAINGDLNGDGQVNTYDATLLQNYLEGLVSFTDEQLAAADFNGDGEVNYSDWIALQSYLISQSCLVLQDITVENGKATACGTEISKAANGTRVTLTADSPSDNMVFDRWIVNEGSVTLKDVNSATTTFTMPDGDVSVTATYKPLSAGETGSLAITVNGFQVGKTLNDCTYTFASTIPGITFSADDILSCSWNQYIVDGMGNYDWYTIPNGEVFQAGTRYKCFIELDNNGLTEAPVVTVNGKTPEYCGIVEEDRVPVALQMDCELGTPALPPITLTVPFTTTVKLGGNTAPGKTTFELAVVGANADEEAYKNVTVSASVTTNGAGSYEGTMTFKGTFQQLQNMLGAGVFVQQVNAGAPNWTYDDKVWGLLLEDNTTALLSLEDEPEYILNIYPTGFEEDGDGGRYYYLDRKAGTVEKMSFTNTYTYSYSAPVRDTATIIIGGEKEESKPVEENPNTGAPVAANMSTLSVLVLAAAVAVLKTRKH